MKISIYKSISGLDIPETEAVSIFQTEYFYKLYELSRETIPYFIVAEENGKVNGLILIQIQNYFSKFLSRFATRSLIIGAPLIFDNKENTLRSILEYYEKIFSGKVIYTQIRNLFDTEEYKKVLSEYGYEYIPHINYLIDLKKSEEELWANVFSKRRNEIRRAEKMEVKVKEIDYKKDFYTTYEILTKVYERARMPIPSIKYFENAKNIFSANKIMTIYGGYINNKLIGVILLLCYNKRVYNWYAGSDYEYIKYYPNDIITWQAILKSKEAGFRIFDFGGAGKPGEKYGVRDFKKKFGGDVKEFGRYEKIHKPLIMKISKSGYKVWQKIK